MGGREVELCDGMLVVVGVSGCFGGLGSDLLGGLLFDVGGRLRVGVEVIMLGC